jgi:hypothetical protein
MGKFIFTNGGGLSVASGPSTTSKANSNLTGFLDAPDQIYGSGADGSVTLDGTTTILSMVPSSSVYTATRDLFFYNLTLSDSVRLNPAGYRIFVQNILMLGNSSVIGHTTGFTTAGSIQQGAAALTSVSHSLGGGGGGVGAGTAAVPTALTGGTNYYYQPFQAVRGYSITGSSTTPTFLRGGAGGASGTGGGVVILAARYISLSSGTATIKAPGTTGAGGGGGGVVIIISSAATLLSGVSTDVTAGTGGTAGTSIYSRVA